MDDRVSAIRKSPLIGRNTCSTVDECYTNEQLTEELNSCQITTPEKAVEWAVMLEDLQIGRMLDCRSGEDSDKELRIWREWERRKKEERGK